MQNNQMMWGAALLSHMSGRAGIVDSDGVLLCVNPAWRDASGPSLCSGWQYFEGANYWSVWAEVAPEDLRERVRAWSRHRRSRFEFDYHLPEAPNIQFRVSFDELPGCDGCMLVHEVEETLEGHVPGTEFTWTSDELFDTILNGFRGGIFDVDFARETITFNPQWHQAMGLQGPSSTIRWDEWRDFVPREDAPELFEQWRAFAKADYQGSFQVEHRQVMRDEEISWVLSRGRVISRDADGKPLRMLGTQSDITDRKDLHEQRAQTERMEGLGRMAHRVSHDFNNLLTVMLMQAELLELELVGNEELSEEVSILRRSIDQASDLTRQMLTFARRQPMSARALDLADFLSSLTPQLEETLGQEHSLVTMTSGGLWQAYVDPGELRGVFEQLMLNARDAMGRPGEVTVIMRNAHLEPRLSRGWSSLSPGDYIQITVRDTGKGMDATTTQHVFEPFYSTRGGSGLGLATCYGIIRQFGGDIRVQSVLRQGTVFDIMLPRAAEERSRERTGEPFVVPESQGNVVLLVEDEQDIRRAAERILMEEGYTVWSASNAAEALDIIESRGLHPNLLLTDVVMPGMSGIELAERLRRHNPELPVAYISGFSRQGFLASDTRSVFLPKPFTASDLRERLAGLFSS